MASVQLDFIETGADETERKAAKVSQAIDKLAKSYANLQKKMRSSGGVGGGVGGGSAGAVGGSGSSLAGDAALTAATIGAAAFRSSTSLTPNPRNSIKYARSVISSAGAGKGLGASFLQGAREQGAAVASRFTGRVGGAVATAAMAGKAGLMSIAAGAASVVTGAAVIAIVASMLEDPLKDIFDRLSKTETAQSFSRALFGDTSRVKALESDPMLSMNRRNRINALTSTRQSIIESQSTFSALWSMPAQIEEMRNNYNILLQRISNLEQRSQNQRYDLQRAMQEVYRL